MHVLCVIAAVHPKLTVAINLKGACRTWVTLSFFSPCFPCMLSYYFVRKHVYSIKWFSAHHNNFKSNAEGSQT